MKLPDGPRTPPFIQLLEGIVRPLEPLEASRQRYGDCFTSRLSGFPPFVVVTSPQAIQEIFTANPSFFESGLGNEISRILVGEHSLLLLDNVPHQRQRQMLIPPFHGERMRAYGKLICDITEQVMLQRNIGQSFSVRSLVQEITLRVIFRTVFGIEEGQRFQQLRQLFSSVLNFLGTPLGSSFLFIPGLQKDLGPWSPWGHFIRQKQEIDRLIYAEIEQRRAEENPTGEDILSLIMSARDEASQQMTNAELHDVLITLLFTGHETTASALAWALYWIHQIPNVHDNLLEELNTIPQNSDPSEFAQLRYLTAICQETLRIYPIALFTFVRIVKLPFRVMGYNFEPGTHLLPCIYLTHHREDIYPEPKRFKPERFLERQFSPYEYLPFGGSNRRCIGMAFAMFEMKLVLASILSRFQLAFSDNRRIRPVRRGLTLAPSDMRMLVTSTDRLKK